MAKFPKDAPRRRVIRVLERLGFTVVRQAEHIAIAQAERRRHNNSSYHAQPPADQGIDAANNLHPEWY